MKAKPQLAKKKTDNLADTLYELIESEMNGFVDKHRKKGGQC
jgi:hypothetical protein